MREKIVKNRKKDRGLHPKGVLLRITIRPPIIRRTHVQLFESLIIMKKILTAVALSSLLVVGAAQAADDTVMVGGQSMYTTKDIVDNAVNSADHTTLVAAVKAAGLVDTLKGQGPFTVVAPTNAAFNKLPPGTVETLVKPDHKEMLTKILTYHVIAGKMTSADLMKAIKQGHGKAELKTVNGATLTAMMNGPKNIVLKDAKGNVANISTYDVIQSNGVIHVIDSVLMPE